MKFITHPNNINNIRKQIEKDYQSADDYMGVCRPRKDFLFGIDIVTDKNMSETYQFPTGKFKRNPNHSLRDNRYFDWVTQEDIDRGTRWMRDIKLLVEIFEERPLYYAIRNSIGFDGLNVCKL